jgi:acyl-CoA dehydrogenase
MSAVIELDPAALPEETAALRAEVREFLRHEVEAGTFDPRNPGQAGRISQEFSRRCGTAGYIGMTWPKRYGGGERSFLERFVVTEEMLAANAPVWAHWVADRQSGPVLMRYGSEALCDEILPRITRGECTFCIGMSEPDSGSDLFAARTRADRVDGGFRVNGTKVWTSSAHRAHYMIALLRTASPTEDNRRHGLTQFLVDMSSEGITINPIINLTGAHDFNEVVFDDVFVPEEHMLGELHMAWKQATSELAYERAGPERFLETIYVLYELVDQAGTEPDDRIAEGIGRLVAQLGALRQMSVSVASMLEAGKVPVTEAALVKDLGTNWEQALPDKVRDLVPAATVDPGNRVDFDTLMGFATLIAPKLTIQGGTREILRGIIARGLGLR